MSLIRNYNQKTFLDIWNNYTDFYNDISGDYSMFKPTDLGDDYLQKAFWLIVARYGDQAITGFRDESRWKLRFFATIDEYAPEWQAKCEMQKEIRATSIEDFKQGNKAVYNTALNPNTEPTTGALDELTYINSQNTTNKKLSFADAIDRKWSLLTDGLNKEFTDKFKNLFSKFLLPDVPLYTYQGGEDNE